MSDLPIRIYMARRRLQHPGALLWQVFVDALASPAQSLLAAKPMLAKINFPREAILMGGLAMVVFHFLVRLVLVAAVLFWWQVPVGPGLLVIPAAIFWKTCLIDFSFLPDFRRSLHVGKERL